MGGMNHTKTLTVLSYFTHIKL